jgi:hypothetical protein
MEKLVRSEARNLQNPELATGGQAANARHNLVL